MRVWTRRRHITMQWRTGTQFMKRKKWVTNLDKTTPSTNVEHREHWTLSVEFKMKDENLVDSVGLCKQSPFSDEAIDLIFMEHTFYGLARWILWHTSYMLRWSAACHEHKYFLGVVYVDSKDFHYLVLISLLIIICW